MKRNENENRHKLKKNQKVKSLIYQIDKVSHFLFLIVTIFFFKIWEEHSIMQEILVPIV